MTTEDRTAVCGLVPWTRSLQNILINVVLKCFNLVEMAGASSLQELFESTHRDAERVDHLVPMMLCCGDDVNVLLVQILDLFLKSQVRTSCVVVAVSASLWCDVSNSICTAAAVNWGKLRRTALRDLIPSTGRWKPIPKDFTTTRMLLRDSLERRRREKGERFVSTIPAEWSW